MKNKGQTMLEAVIALAAILLVLAAVSISVISSLSNSTFIEQQNQANKLAQQGMEYLRDQITNNGKFADFASTPGTYCFNDIALLNPFTPGICTTANIQEFKREVTFTTADCNGIKAVVYVRWVNGKCTGGTTFCHKQEISSCFTDPSLNNPVGL